MWSEWVFTLSSIMLSGFKVQESGPNMHIGRLHDYILSQLILSFKSLKIKKKKQATQVGTVPSPQSILDAYQQGADPNTMVSAAGPWSCGSFIVTCGWILYIYIIIYIYMVWAFWIVGTIGTLEARTQRSWVKLNGRLLFPPKFTQGIKKSYIRAANCWAYCPKIFSNSWWFFHVHAVQRTI